MSALHILRDVIVALKAPNYGAKVGQAIAGALGRGQGGRFARVGGATAPAPKRPKASRTDTLSAAGVSEDEAKRLEAFAAGGEDDGKMDTLFEKGLIDLAGGKPVLSPQGKAFLRALKRGDKRGASDSLAKAGARVNREAGKPAKGDKPKAGGGKGGDKEAERAAAKRERDAETAQRYANRIEEITTQVDTSRSMSEAQIVRARNRLSEIDTDIDGLDIPEGQKVALRDAITAARGAIEKRTGKKLPQAGSQASATAAKEAGAFTVFKDASGALRWVAVSSNSFRDREGEIVSQKALEDDIARTDAAGGDHGPLRVWHMGRHEFGTPLDWTTVKAADGWDIGDCDFAAMHGRMLIESGTFRNPEFAEMFGGDGWQMSIGFAHPPDEPVSGVFNNVRRFERSVLPAGQAANAFTSFAVMSDGTFKESDMDVNKEKVLAEKVGPGALDKLKAALFGASKTEQKALADGVAFKETDAGADTEAKAEGDMPEDAAAETEDVPTLGDMSIDEAVATIVAHPLFVEALGSVTKSLDGLAPAIEKAISAQEATAAKEAGEKSALLKEIAELKATVKELSGDAPSAQRGGFRASESPSTTTKAAEEIAAAADAAKNADTVNEWNPMVAALKLPRGSIVIE